MSTSLMMGLSLNSATLGAGVGSPVTILGASLLAWWTADRADLITLNGSAVTSWKDVVAGYDALQGVGASRPLYSATSFNAAPGLTFDGTDDELTCTSASLLAALPDGAEPGEIWSIVQQNALAADASTRHTATYGGGGVNVSRRLSRVVDTGVNRLLTQTGSGGAVTNATNPNVNFSSRHLVKGVFGATQTVARIDQAADATAAVVPATGASRLRLGANDVAVASGFLNGIMRDTLVTLPLSAAQITALNAWALPRRML
jgi:hypothetical protein